MAAIYVTEYRLLAMAPNASNYAPVPTQAPMEPALADYVVAISGSSTQGPVFGAYTAMIRVHADSICSITVGLNPTATTTNKRMIAGQTEYFGVQFPQQIAVVTNV